MCLRRASLTSHIAFRWQLGSALKLRTRLGPQYPQPTTPTTVGLWAPLAPPLPIFRILVDVDIGLLSDSRYFYLFPGELSLDLCSVKCSSNSPAGAQLQENTFALHFGLYFPP